MKNKLLKLIVIVSTFVFCLLGCQSNNDKIMKVVLAELNDKYNEEFEVVAIGARIGTKTNNTVTSYVKGVQNSVVFSVEVDTEGNIIKEDYPRRKIGSEVGLVLVEALKQFNIESQANLHISGGTEILEATIPLKKYIELHSPDYFVGKVVLKENNQITAENLFGAYEAAYRKLNNTPLQTDIWVISTTEYEKAVNDFSQNPDVSEEWFDDYEVTSTFHLDFSSKGIETNNEDLKKVN